MMKVCSVHICSYLTEILSKGKNIESKIDKKIIVVKNWIWFKIWLQINFKQYLLSFLYDY